MPSLRFTSPLPPDAIRRRLRAQLADTRLRAVLQHTEAAKRPLAGDVSETEFRLTVRPEGRPGTAAVCRGRILPGADATAGAVVEAQIDPTPTWILLMAVLGLIGFVVIGSLIGGPLGVAVRAWAADWVQSPGRAMHDPRLATGILLVVFLLAPLSLWPRYGEEKAVLRAALRESAGLPGEVPDAAAS